MLYWLKSLWNKWIIDTLACLKQSDPIENVRWERFRLKVTFSVGPDSKIALCVFGRYTSTGRGESSINGHTRTVDSDCGNVRVEGRGAVPLTDQLLFFQGHSSKMVVLHFRRREKIKKDPPLRHKSTAQCVFTGTMSVCVWARQTCLTQISGAV